MTPLDLLGTWELSRVVDDHLTGERRDVRGTATLELESPDRVRWSEEGTMSWPGHEVPVFRTLFVVRSGGAWFVEFEDGRPFHPWRSASGSATSVSATSTRGSSGSTRIRSSAGRSSGGRPGRRRTT